MDPFTVGGMLLGVAFISLSLTLAQRRTAALRAILIELANEWGATLTMSSTWSISDTSVDFLPSESLRRARLYYHSSGGRHPVFYTDFTAPTRPQTTAWRLHLRPQHGFDAVGRLIGLQDIRIGYPALDEPFVIKSDNTVQTAIFFAHTEVRERLLTLLRLRVDGRPELLFERDVLRIREHLWLEDAGSIREFMQCCAELYRRLPGGVSYPLSARF